MSNVKYDWDKAMIKYLIHTMLNDMWKIGPFTHCYKLKTIVSFWGKFGNIFVVIQHVDT